MIEKHFILDDIDLRTFYGAGNTNLQMIKALYPKLRIVARGNVMKVLGDEEEMCVFDGVIQRLKSHCLKFNSLDEAAIVSIVRGEKNGMTPDGGDPSAICYSISGRAITPRSDNQKRFVEDYRTNDMLFAVGPAGSGKTYVSIALAVRALKNKEVRRIILSRPAVEAGEKLGFLPGDMKDKIDPYLQPLYDALLDMIPAQKLQEYMELQTIQIAPLAFMRGRTLNDAVVILDEAQNTTPQQIKMFLTRMGHNTKMIITGDVTQIDLPRTARSGLVEAMTVLDGVKGISFIMMDERDIVRHKLVTRIVNAYREYEEKTSPSPSQGGELHPDGNN